MLRRNIIANYLGQGWTALMGLAFIPLYIHYLGMEAYGLIGLFAMVQAWMVLLDVGLVSALGREMARYSSGAHDVKSIRNLLRSVETIGVSLCVAVAMVAYGLSEWVAANWLQITQMSSATVAQALSIIGMVVGLRFIENVYRSCLLGLQRQVAVNLIGSVMATVRGVGAVGILAWVDQTIIAYFVWQGAVSVMTTASMAVATYRTLPRSEVRARFSLDELHAIRKFVGGVSGIIFLALLLTQADKVLLSRLLPLESFGIYAFVATITSGLYMTVGPISQAYFPKFVELAAKHDADGLASSFHQGSQLVSVVMGPLAVVMIIFSAPILTIWTSNPELAEKAGGLLSVMTLGTMLNAMMYLPAQVQLAHGWTKLALWSNLVGVLVLVPAIFLVVPVYEALGAAWIWVSLNAAYVFVSQQFMFRKMLKTERAYWYLRDLFLPMIAASLVALMGLCIFPNPGGTLLQLMVVLAIWFLASVAAAFAAPMVREKVAKYFRSANLLPRWGDK